MPTRARTRNRRRASIWENFSKMARCGWDFLVGDALVGTWARHCCDILCVARVVNLARSCMKRPGIKRGPSEERARAARNELAEKCPALKRMVLVGVVSERRSAPPPNKFGGCDRDAAMDAEFAPRHSRPDQIRRPPNISPRCVRVFAA